MKNFRIIIATLVFSLLFAGTALAADKNELANNAARHLIQKSNEAMEGTNSFKLEGVIEMLMNMEVAGESETMEAEVTLEGLVDLPGKIYIKYDVDMGMDYVETVEMFIKEDGIFAKTPMLSEEWEVIGDAGSTELMAMSLSGDTAMAEEMLAEMGLDIAAIEDKIYSNASYTRNVKLLGKTYYVVDMSFDVGTLVKEMMSYMEGIYIAQEADMYEGYAEEAMFMMNMLTEKIGGTADISMFIEKDTYNMGYMSMILDVDMDMEALLGVKMDMFVDYFLAYSEFGSKDLPFPVIAAPVVEAEEIVEEAAEVEEVEEIEEVVAVQ